MSDRRKHVGSGSRGKGTPMKVRARPPGKREQDPTAISTRVVPRLPRDAGWPQPLGAPSPPPPRELGPNGTPATGARLNLHPSVCSIPEPQSRGSAPRRQRPNPCPHVTASSDLAPERAADSRSHGTGQGDERRGGEPDAGQAWRDPSPTQRGEAQALVGTKAMLGPTVELADPSQRGGSAQHATVVTPHWWPRRAEEWWWLWVLVPQGTLLDP